MASLYLPLLLIFAVFGAFCLNLGHRRAFRLVLKALLKGQLAFMAQRAASLAGDGRQLSQEDITRAYCSYETIGQLVLGWYKYFGAVRDDKELRILKAQIREGLGDYLSAIEAAAATRLEGRT